MAYLGASTSAGLSAQMRTNLEKRFLDRVVKNFIFNQFGEVRNIPLNHGLTDRWPRYVQPTVSVSGATLVEGEMNTASVITSQYVDVTIAEYGNWFPITELAKKSVVDPDVLGSFADIAGDDASGTLDQVTREALFLATNIQRVQNAAADVNLTSTFIMTVSELRKGVRDLKKRKAKPYDGKNWVFIACPDTTYDIQGDTAWKDPNQYANNAEKIFSGEIGKIYGVKIVETNDPKITATGASAQNVFHNFLIGKGAYAKASLTDGNNGMDGEYSDGIHIMTPKDLAQPIARYGTVSWEKEFGAAILNNNFITKISCQASV
jgi:N4-gp56 family major capsid protein